VKSRFRYQHAQFGHLGAGALTSRTPKGAAGAAPFAFVSFSLDVDQ